MISKKRSKLELIRVRIEKSLRQNIEKCAKEAERPFSAEVRRTLKNVYESSKISD